LYPIHLSLAKFDFSLVFVPHHLLHMKNHTHVLLAIQCKNKQRLIFKMKYVFSYVCLAHAASGLFFARYLALVVF